MAVIKPTFTIVRAVGALFARRFLRIGLIIGIGVAVLLHGLGTYAVFQDRWWWLLEAIFIFLTLVFIIAAAIVLVILRLIEPRQTSAQKQAVANFVEKLERVTENLKTPMPLVVLFVAKDTIMPREDGFIETIARDSTTLAPDFDKLRREFDRN